MSRFPVVVLTLTLGFGAWAGGDDELATTALEGPSAEARPQMQLEVVGVTVTPHLRAEDMHYDVQPPGGELGARIQIFVRNAAETPAGTATINELRFDQLYPLNWLLQGDWSWHDTPNVWPNRERVMPPGALSVWTVNAVNRTWEPAGRLMMSVSDWSRSHMSILQAPVTEPELWIAAITFLGEDIRPDRMVAHVTNDSDAPITIASARLWLPESKADYRKLYAGEALSGFTTYPADGVIPPGEKGVIAADTGALPLSYTAVEIGYEDANGEPGALWGHVRIKREQFDIAGGWINSRTKHGDSALLHETFLKSQKYLYVNAAHIGRVPGYNLPPGESELHQKYPIKIFGHLTPIAEHDTDAMLPHIHGAELLGEPQLPFAREQHLPQQVALAFDPYRPTRLPTTITLSDESSFRHYAGLSDYPHYDAYRVIAPSADVWGRYDRWRDGSRISWGSPLEGVGELSRVLRELSRPMPTAVWSQGPHHNWYVIDGRTRLSPTAGELRAQAYHSLSARITSLYWFNLSLQSLIQFRDTLEPMRDIGREIFMLEDFYLEGDAYRHVNIADGDGYPLWDLASIAAPQGALLFAMDLDYAPDHDEKVFVFREREGTFDFDLPAWLRDPVDVFRVDARGAHDVDHAVTDAGVRIEDTVEVASMYVATRDANLRAAIEARRAALLEREAALDWDPANNDEHFAALKALHR